MKWNKESDSISYLSKGNLSKRSFQEVQFYLGTAVIKITFTTLIK